MSRPRTVPVVLALLLALSAAGSRPLPGATTSDEPLQMIVVRTAHWDAVEATLEWYERASASASWRRMAPPVRAVVGRNGLGWGIGLHTAPVGGGPVKREGDGRAPAGVFRLSAAFGYGAADRMQWLRMPYIHSTENHVCVDDVRSPQYNRIVDRRGTGAVTWSSHEEMLRRDDLYRLGIVIDHNASPPSPGGGSCIFLHIWQGESQPTSGCTAVSAEHLESILRWLDLGKRPVLVQLPNDVYGELRADGLLP